MALYSQNGDAKDSTRISQPSLEPSTTQQTESEAMLEAVDKLKFFLATAPGSFDQAPYDMNDGVAREERCLNRFALPTGELISCVLWNGLYHISA